MMGIEKFFPINGYEGHYEINRLGQVKSLGRFVVNGIGNVFLKERILKQRTNKDGYYSVQLCKNGVEKSNRIHRIIAIALIPNAENKPCVNHINGIKTDNRVENIEWCTILENNKHAMNNNLCSYNKKRVICTKTGEIWESVTKCAIDNNIKRDTLDGYINNRCYNPTTFKRFVK